MAGIGAVSLSKTHSASGADVAATGFVVNERITLSTDPAGSGYAWALSAPNDSAPVVSALDDDTDASPAFMPDVPGLYLVTVTVDGATLYILRMSVASVATARICEVQHDLPLTDAQVATPQVGYVRYCGADHGNRMVIKKSDGTVHLVDLTPA